MPAGTPLFPVYCGRVRIPATPAGHFDFDEGGADLTAQPAAGDYFLTGIGDATDLALAIKTAMDAVATQVYTVTVEYSETTGTTTATVTISAAAPFTLQFGSGSGFSPLELGFPVADSGPSTSHVSTLSPVSGWMPDQPIVKIEPDPDEIPAVELVTPGNRAFVFISGTLRTPRTDELRLVNDDRTLRIFSAADEARTFQAWWNVVRDGRAIRLLHAVDPENLAALEVVGSFRLRGDAVARMPRAVRPGRANLYNFDLPLRNFV